MCWGCLGFFRRARTSNDTVGYIVKYAHMDSKRYKGFQVSLGGKERPIEGVEGVERGLIPLVLVEILVG